MRRIRTIAFLTIAISIAGLVCLPQRAAGAAPAPLAPPTRIEKADYGFSIVTAGKWKQGPTESSDIFALALAYPVPTPAPTGAGVVRIFRQPIADGVPLGDFVTQALKQHAEMFRDAEMEKPAPYKFAGRDALVVKGKSKGSLKAEVGPEIQRHVFVQRGSDVYWIEAIMPAKVAQIATADILKMEKSWKWLGPEPEKAAAPAVAADAPGKAAPPARPAPAQATARATGNATATASAGGRGKATAKATATRGAATAVARSAPGPNGEQVEVVDVAIGEDADAAAAAPARAPAPAAMKPAPAGFKSVASAKFQVGLNYPQEWTYIETKPESGVAILLYPDKVMFEPGGLAENLTVVVAPATLPNADAPTAKAQADDLLEAMKKKYDQFTLVKEEDLKVGGIDARRVVAEFDVQENFTRWSVTVLVRNGQAYNFIYSADVRDYDKWAKQVDAAIESVQWTGRAAAAPKPVRPAPAKSQPGDGLE